MKGFKFHYTVIQDGKQLLNDCFVENKEIGEKLISLWNAKYKGDYSISFTDNVFNNAMGIQTIRTLDGMYINNSGMIRFKTNEKGGAL